MVPIVVSSILVYLFIAALLFIAGYLTGRIRGFDHGTRLIRDIQDSFDLMASKTQAAFAKSLKEVMFANESMYKWKELYAQVKVRKTKDKLETKDSKPTRRSRPINTVRNH